MAEKDIPITNNLDLEGNKLKNAKVDTPPVANDDIANKQYVDDNAVSEMVTTRNTDYEVGNIPVGTDVNGQTSIQVLTDMLFGVIPPTYTPPEITLTIKDDLAVDIPDVYFEIGQTLTNYTMNAGVVNNDSNGLNGGSPYEFTTPAGSTSQATPVFAFTHQIVAGDNIFELDVSMLGATIKNDNTGTPNATGQFGDAVYNDTVSLQGIWAYYNYFGDTAFEPNYTAPSEIKALNKTVLPLPEEITYTIPAGQNTSIIMAVPTEKEIYIYVEGVEVGILNEMTSILHQKLDGVPIPSIMPYKGIEKLYVELEDAESAGDTEIYSVFVWRTDKPYSKDTNIVIKFRDITGAAVETSTYFDTYYIDEYYTD